jgi:hypothetical protein
MYRLYLCNVTLTLHASILPQTTCMLLGCESMYVESKPFFTAPRGRRGVQIMRMSAVVLYRQVLSKTRDQQLNMAVTVL